MKMTTVPLKISSLKVQRLDIPLAQPIVMSFGTVSKQNIVLVRIADQDGAEGCGEAAILGGPYWGTESAEGVQAAIEKYIAPAILGVPLGGLEAAALLLGKTIRGNAAAKSAVEMAILDLLGRRLDASSAIFLGGLCRTQIPVAWTLSTGNVETDIAEGESALLDRGHRRFKVKLAKTNIAQDVQRVASIIEAFRGRATVIADVNQGWDEVTALRYLPLLQEAGLEAIEQPLPGHDLAGIVRVRSRLNIEVIADEVLTDASTALLLSAKGAASVFALKPNRDGGVINTKRLAGIANAAGIKLYGGTALETSLGTAASAILYGSIPELQLGSELFGPLRLECDLAGAPLSVRNGVLDVPTGPGLGVTLDEDRIRELAERTSSDP
ncbi:MAG: muconate cycloisomerase [Caballeronia sp.]|jgi:muconate cycloisomerase|nr:muconate cycloisomerase [Caballeronia sp.]